MDYLFEAPTVDRDMIRWKGQSKEEVKENLNKILEILETQNSSYQAKIMELTLKDGKGNVLWPLRVALSGSEKSPDPFTLLDILGTKESIKRIGNANENL